MNESNFDKPIATNQQKYQNYREQFKRLNRAITYKFNLEATFIAYAIMEDRSESLLRHIGKYDVYLKKRGRFGPTLDSKLKYIQKLAEEKKSILHRYFSDDLIDKIIKWKDERNGMVHTLLKQELTHEDIERFAINGKELACKFRSKVTSANRAIEKVKDISE